MPFTKIAGLMMLAVGTAFIFQASWGGEGGAAGAGLIKSFSNPRLSNDTQLPARQKYTLGARGVSLIFLTDALDVDAQVMVMLLRSEDQKVICSRRSICTVRLHGKSKKQAYPRYRAIWSKSKTYLFNSLFLLILQGISRAYPEWWAWCPILRSLACYITDGWMEHPLKE